MGLVPKENLVVFYTRAPQETEVNARGSCLQPAVNNEERRKGKEQASSSVPMGKGQTGDFRQDLLSLGGKMWMIVV